MKTVEKHRFQKIKRIIFKKSNFYYFLIVFILYISFNVWINQIYATNNILTEIAIWFLIPFVAFNFIIIPILVATTVTLAIFKLKNAVFVVKTKEKSKARKKAKGGIFALIGTFFGVFGGACPGCFVGLFPAVLGIFGTTRTLSILPLFGLEIQIFSSILLVVAIFLLSRDNVCKVNF